MRVEVFQDIPQQAVEIRHKVFITEQGFSYDLDDIDPIAIHFVLFDDSDIPVAACRVFQDVTKGCYLLGRLAVAKESRGKHMGSFLVTQAEEYVRQLGGGQIQLHAQCRSTDFYQKLGFSAYGEVEYEEDCPHIWMRKYL